MAGASLVYSNARVKAMENSLLSHDKITRISYSTDIAAAVHVLYESNYAGGLMVDNPYAYERLLGEEYRIIADFLREAMPDKSALKTLLMQNDYHNAKAMYKAKCMNMKDCNYMLMPPGNIPIDTLRYAIDESSYMSLPDTLAKALAAVSSLEEVAPAMIDTIIDKAMFAEIISVATKLKSKALIKYWQANIDLTNIATLLRVKHKVGGAKLLEESFITGGLIIMENIIKLVDATYEVIAEKLRYTDYGKIVAIGVEEYKSRASLVAYEREWDNYLMNLFRSGRNDLFTISPIAGFYIAKKIELKSLRMMFVCIKNNVHVQEIKQRLRDIYA